MNCFHPNYNIFLFTFCKMLSFKKRCCDPLGLKKCTKKMLPIRPSIRFKLVNMNVEGQNICSSCNIKISNFKVSEATLKSSPLSTDVNSLELESSDSKSDSFYASESESNTEPDQESEESDDELAEYEKSVLIDSLNHNILPVLRVSPITLQKTSSKKYTNQKLQQVCSGLKKVFQTNEDLVTSSELELHKWKALQFDDFIHKLKTKFHDAKTKNEKYLVLTMAPSDWSARKIEAEFGCSFHMAKSSKNLQAEKGVLSIPDPKLPSNVLGCDTKKLAEEFYLNDDISRVMPGKNDCVSMKVNGKNLCRICVLCSVLVSINFI